MQIQVKKFNSNCVKLKLLSLFSFICFFYPPETYAVEPAKTEKKADMKTSFQYEEIAPLQIGEELNFPDFKLVYLQEEDPEANSEAKSTRNIRIRHFVVKGKNGDHKIKVVHGQLPPSPLEIKLDKAVFILHTFKTPAGAQLFPDKLFITKK